MADPQTIDLSGIADAKGGAPKDDISLEGIPDASKKPEQKSRGAQIREESLARRQKAETRRQSGEEPVLQGLMGAGHGAISTVQGLAAPVRRLFGMQPATPPPEEHTTSGKVGRAAEQVGEFLLPEAGAGKVASAVKGGRLVRGAVKAGVTGLGSGVLAAAQGDEYPVRAGAIGAAGPVVDLAAPAAWKLLREGSKKSLAKVLGASPTSSEALTKAVQKVVPAALDEGLKPTWGAWLRQRKSAQNKAGQSLEAALAGPLGGSLVPLGPVQDALTELKNSAAQHIMSAQQTARAAGQAGATTIPGTLRSGTVVYNKRLLKYIEDLQSILRDHGTHIQARQLVDLKRSWDDFVYKAKEFPNSKQILTGLEARAKHTAANAIRGVLDKDVPTLADLDKAYSLNTRLYELVRKAASGGDVGEIAGKTGSKLSSNLGMRAARMGAVATIGAGAGYEQSHTVTGSIVGGLIGGASARILETAFASPAWKVLPAVTKQALADAISSGNAETIRKAVSAITTKMVAGIQTRINQLKTSAKKDEGKTSSTSLTGLEKASGIGPTGMDRAYGELNASRQARGLGDVDKNVRAEMPIGPASEKAIELLMKRGGPEALKALEEAAKNPKVAEFISNIRYRELMKKFGGRATEEVAESSMSQAQKTALHIAGKDLNASPDELARLKQLLFGE